MRKIKLIFNFFSILTIFMTGYAFANSPPTGPAGLAGFSIIPLSILILYFSEILLFKKFKN